MQRTLWGESKILLKKYFEETIALFAKSHQQKEAAVVETHHQDNKKASAGPDLVNHLKTDIANLIKNEAHNEVLKILTIA